MEGLGDRLRSLREQRGLSMSDLARNVGVSRSYIWRLEHDQRRLNTRLIGDLAKALEVEPSVLIGGEPRAAAERRQETLIGHLLAVRPLNPRFVTRVLEHIAGDLLPDDPDITTIRDWDSRLLDMGSRAALLTRLAPKAGRIAERLDELDRSMDYREFRRRMLAGITRWPARRRELFVSELLPEILRRPGHYRRLTGEDIFRDPEDEASRLRRFPLLLDGDDPRDAVLLRSGTTDLTSSLTREGMFAFRMPDESMAPRYPVDALLLAHADRPVPDGSPAVVRVDGFATTCRIYRREGEKVRLTPIDGRFPEVAHTADDVRWAHPVIRAIVP